MSDAIPSTSAIQPTGIQSTAGGLSTDTSRLKSADNLKKAGEKFEAVFTGMMLKSMRQTHLAEPLFDSKAIDTFRDMQDQRLAQTMAEHAPMGIGKAMTAFLAKGQANLASQADVNTSVADPPAS
ncbi:MULTISPECIES: rod-binding protein [unclassified Sphingomonas]|uniref:rod-binding protein n=1 Tax=unclassified Sphingomonas TaxID=196159 RepID=UPI001E3DE5E0|nr:MULTISPECIES: rod-binding protein [unclassified Sphingomonas]